MKLILVLLVAIACVALADETDDEPKPVSHTNGIAIAHCHVGDPALIHVIPIPMNEQRVQGWFTTTNTLLTLKDFSMLPSGLNRLEVQSICRGMTGEVSSVVIDLQRPPPPPKIVSKRVRVVNTNSPVPIRMGVSDKGGWQPPPPMPPGMAERLPLPDEQHGASTNKMSYKDMDLMRRYYARERRQ